MANDNRKALQHTAGSGAFALLLRQRLVIMCTC